MIPKRGLDSRFLTVFQVDVRHRWQRLVHSSRMIRLEDLLVQRIGGDVHPRHADAVQHGQAGDGGLCFRCGRGGGGQRIAPTVASATIHATRLVHVGRVDGTPTIDQCLNKEIYQWWRREASVFPPSFLFSFLLPFFFLSSFLSFFFPPSFLFLSSFLSFSFLLPFFFLSFFLSFFFP